MEDTGADLHSDAGAPFIVCSEVMHRLLAMARRIARNPAAVLLVGETGTGKELLANFIHCNSLRASQPFIDINCAALPEHLVESELFGYEKGAFSGADRVRPGLFELADNGTLLLDEIGDLEPKLQAKLLRVLDGVAFYRLGGTRKVSVDVRIIAATNIHLETAVREGRFRNDLYHRLSQFQLRVPALRERTDDIVPIAQSFLAEQKPEGNLSQGAIDALLAYSWPGNIRELKNVMMQAAMAVAGSTVTCGDLPRHIQQAVRGSTMSTGVASAVSPAESPSLSELKRQAILRALDSTNGHQDKAARQLGISRRTLSRKLEEYGIDARKTGTRADVPLGAMRQEQAEAFRVSLDGCIVLESATGERLAVRLTNISAKGIGVCDIPRTPALMSEFRFEVTLPDSDGAIRGLVGVVWANTKGCAGLNYMSMDSKSKETLDSFLERKRREEGWVAANGFSNSDAVETA